MPAIILNTFERSEYGAETVCAILIWYQLISGIIHSIAVCIWF